MNKDFSEINSDFISASIASKKVGYAQDYIGYLIRTGKVPGKMYGRSWYVDFNVLSAYKKNNKSKKPKKNEFSTKNQSKISKNYSHSDFLIYESEPVSRLPELKKLNSRIAKVIPPSPLVSPYVLQRKSPRKVQKGNLYLVIGILVLSVVFGLKNVELFNNIKSNLQGINTQNSNVAAVSAPKWYEKVFSSLINLFDENNKEIDSKVQVAGAKTNSENGIVVVPENSNHDALVSKVKNAFSNEVEVTVDQDGKSGVIVPTFKSGDESENYAFILVPIKSQND